MRAWHAASDGARTVDPGTTPPPGRRTPCGHGRWGGGDEDPLIRWFPWDILGRIRGVARPPCLDEEGRAHGESKEEVESAAEREAVEGGDGGAEGAHDRPAGRGGRCGRASQCLYSLGRELIRLGVGERNGANFSPGGDDGARDWAGGEEEALGGDNHARVLQLQALELRAEKGK